MTGDARGGAVALRDARLARRRARPPRLADAIFGAYAAVLVVAIYGSMASSAIGHRQLDRSTLSLAAVHGPGVVGLMIVTVIMAALRSGARGGPLIVDDAEVQQWWLTPLPRRVAMRASSRRTVALWIAAGVLGGMAVAILLAQRVPGATSSWAASLVVTGASTATLAAGVALAGYGSRLGVNRADLASLGVIAAAATEAVLGTSVLPTSMLGARVIEPLNGTGANLGVGAAAVMLATGVVTATLGWRLSPRGSIERLLYRAHLVQQLRLAVAVRDVRTFLLLRRQLGRDVPRAGPRLRLRAGAFGRMPVTRRVVDGVLRWPTARLLASFGVAIGVGAALAGFAEGGTPLVLVAGIALWAVALQATDALAAEIDRGDSVHGNIRGAGRLHAQHLLVGVVGILPFAVASACVYRFLTYPPWSTVLALAVGSAVTAAVGAAMTAARPPDYARLADPTLVTSPEAAAGQAIVSLAMPVLVTMVGFLPVALERANSEANPFLLTGTVALVVLTGGVVWLRLRQAVRQRWRTLASEPVASVLRTGMRATAASARNAPMTVDASAAVSLRKAQKDWGSTSVGPLDLDIAAGERVVLVGRNGAGKTTLLRLAAGLYDLSSGEIFVLGHAAGSVGARRALAFLPDTPVFFDDISIREQCRYVAALCGVSDPVEAADAVLERVGLAGRSDDVPARLSLGMKQKAAVALALVRPFRVLFADEPFRALDAQGATATADLLRDAAESGATLVVSTHQLDRLGAFDRMIALDEGRVRYDGPVTGAAATDALRGMGVSPST